MARPTVLDPPFPAPPPFLRLVTSSRQLFWIVTPLGRCTLIMMTIPRFEPLCLSPGLYRLLAAVYR
jgi:hypothetical protein